MNNSILDSVKSSIGIASDYDVFDDEIIMSVNSTLAVLYQLGIGPTDGYAITGDADTWDDLLGVDIPLNMVKSYIYVKTKLAIDPPSTSFAIQALETQASEYEWRMVVAKEQLDMAKEA